MQYCMFSCRLSPCLSIDVCLQSTVCLSVYLRSGVSYYERLIFDISNGHQSKFFKKFSTFLTFWTSSIPFILVSGSFCLHFSGSTLIFCFRANHLPSKRRVATVVPNFDEELKVFKCISPLCKVTQKKRFNIVRHIKRCLKIVDRKK